jgi:hypothetical protein
MAYVRCELGLPHRPSRELAPAGDLLFERPKSRQKVAPAPSPLAARGVPCDARSPRPAQNSLRSLRSLRSDSCAESAVEARCARASGSCASRLLQRGMKEQPTASPGASTRNGSATRARRPVVGICLSPFSAAEERKDLKPRAQHASRTDSARLFDRSVAKGVPCGASGLEYRREPAAQLRAVRSGALSLPTFLYAQESRSPARANSGLDAGMQRQQRRTAHSP